SYSLAERWITENAGKQIMNNIHCRLSILIKMNITLFIFLQSLLNTLRKWNALIFGHFSLQLGQGSFKVVFGHRNRMLRDLMCRISMPRCLYRVTAKQLSDCFVSMLCNVLLQGKLPGSQT